MKNLRQASILISGMGSVGVEIAKNLILGGVRHITIHDTKEATWRDLSAQFYLSEENLGSNRAGGCFVKLEELNDSVQCSLSTMPLTEELVKEFDVSGRIRNIPKLIPCFMNFLAHRPHRLVVRRAAQSEWLDAQAQEAIH
jgi:tRNA A37 threonylcarbamoyladenosine dehydratase